MIVGQQQMAAFDSDAEAPGRAPSILEVARILDTAPRERVRSIDPESQEHVRMSGELCRRLANALRADHARLQKLIAGTTRARACRVIRTAPE